MKRVVRLIAPLLVASHCSYAHERDARDTAGVTEIICITTDFAVDVEYPNFWVTVLAHLGGAHTDSLKFVEWDIRTRFSLRSSCT